MAAALESLMARAVEIRREAQGSQEAQQAPELEGWRKGGPGQQEDNVRLALAAPSLLEALELSATVVHSPHVGSLQDCQLHHCARNKAAIRRARGAGWYFF